MNKRALSRICRSLVLMALLLSSLPVGQPVLSQAPVETPPPPPQPPLPPGGAFRLTPADTPPNVETPIMPDVKVDAADTTSAPSPAMPQSPNICSAPAKIPFGQDNELLMGLMWSYTSYRVDQSPAWGGTSQVSAMGTLTTSVTGCASNPTGEQVYFYENTDYGGNCYLLGPGTYKDGSCMCVHNDHLSSVKVGGNVNVTIYDDSN